MGTRASRSDARQGPPTGYMNETVPVFGIMLVRKHESCGNSMILPLRLAVLA